MTLQLSEHEISQVLQLRDVMREVLNTEPGQHPELPELIHRLIKALVTTVIHLLREQEQVVMELAQHKLDQEINETALLKIFADLGVFGPDTFQKAVVQATEELGSINIGKA